MNRTDIAQHLRAQYAAFAQLLASLPEAEYRAAPEGKWANGQHLDHLVRSVGPVNMALGLPHFLLRWLFGIANRPSRDYAGLVEKYRAKLAAGGRATGRFVPPPAEWPQRGRLLQNLERQVKKLAEKTVRLSEEQLDTLLLPHPLLGKLTLREMLYFTMYHAEHHRAAVEKAIK
jgi:hypothetical protein